MLLLPMDTINSLLLIYLVYYMRLMLGRLSLLVPCMLSIRATMKNLSDHKKIFVSQ